MNYFREPIFDLLKFGQSNKRPVSRHSFSRHIVDLAAKTALQITDAQGLKQGRELLHNQLARLTWTTYIWIVPLQKFRTGHHIYPVPGYENVLPDSLLGTAILYRHQFNSADPNNRLYCHSMVCNGLEWACHKAQNEGGPNVHADMPTIDCSVLNALFENKEFDMA